MLAATPRPIPTRTNMGDVSNNLSAHQPSANPTTIVIAATRPRLSSPDQVRPSASPSTLGSADVEHGWNEPAHRATPLGGRGDLVAPSGRAPVGQSACLVGAKANLSQ